MEYLVVEFLGSLLYFVEERRGRGVSGSLEKKNKGKTKRKEKKKERREAPSVHLRQPVPPFREPATGLCAESTVTCRWF